MTRSAGTTSGVGCEDRGRDSVLALVPSSGQGGGIEAYVIGVLEALEASGVSVQSISLTRGHEGAGLRQKARFTVGAAVAAQRRRHTRPLLVCFHPGLLPAALLCRRLCGAGTALRLFLYGIEIWQLAWAKRLLIRHCDIELTTISEFSAGSLMHLRPASVLVPPLPEHRYRMLRAVGAARAPSHEARLHILSVFRLADFEDKGGNALVEAVGQVRRRGALVTLTIAGASAGSDQLRAEREDRSDWLTIVADPSDAELVEIFAAAELFVLATRLRRGPNAYGEGFGIVLIEAALAGLPVVAPWGGGGHAAMIEGVTGFRPADQSPQELADAIEWALAHRAEAHQMGHNGHLWAARNFDPATYRSRVQKLLLAQQPPVAPSLDLSFESEVPTS